MTISALSAYTHFQLRYWKNSLTLFQHALEVTENNHMAHLCMAEALGKRGRLDEAVLHCRKALEIAPESTTVQINLGYFLAHSSRNNEAVELYYKLLQKKPDAPLVLNALGTVLIQQGKSDEAFKCFTKALQIKPDLTDAHINLGHLLYLKGELDQAVKHLQVDPYSDIANYYLGQVFALKGDIKQAIVHQQEALRLRPDWIEPMNNLAWLLATRDTTTTGDADRAIKLAKRVCELTDYRQPSYLDTLAAAYAAGGDFGKAVETAQKAVELCQLPGQDTLKRKIDERLTLYKTGKPYVDGN